MTISKQEAIDLVQRIADHHGHLDEKTLATINAETRLKVERALLAKDKLIGQSVITLARELYSKDVRFIFELLQNADDNHFARAKSDGQDPYVSFCVYHDKIIVECNEDGFTEENLRAICSIGQSSKHGAQGYIGEKGIGFKSIFKVAWKVHIQSGAFSFCFTHRPGDSGMGMISPEWYSPQNSTSPPIGITRMTFILHNKGDQQVQAAQRQNIANEFKDFQPAMLLFLKQLKRIEVRLFDVGGNKEADTVMSLSRPGNVPHRAIITTITASPNSEPEKCDQFYHVTKLSAKGLAKNENRAYSLAEEKSKAYSQAAVVIAFPLTDQSVPIIEPQDIFAFLPIRKIGFNFLIHTDFVTMANREDIVTSSERNKGLRRYLAKAFVRAVQEMCEHPQLRFQWMRYLPPLTGNHWDPFWSEVSNLLEHKIAKANVIVPFKPTVPLKTLTQLRQWPGTPRCLDHLNRPVFDDLPGDKAVYLSLEYQESDLAILWTYGMTNLLWQDLVSRAEADLQRSSSKMKDPKTDAEWHSLAANILKKALNDCSRKITDQIKALPLLPLSDGRWVSIVDGRVYFPATVEGFSIPAVLKLRLLQADAAAQPERKALFQALGVASALSSSIRSLVMMSYVTKSPLTLDDSVAMLRFLYLTRPTETPAKLYEKVSVMSSTLYHLMPADSDVYFRDGSDPFGPAALGLTVDFLHQNYLQEPPQRPEDFNHADPNKGWNDWLQQHIGIRTRLRVATRNDSGEPVLSKEVLHVAERHPAKLLGLLHHLWSSEGTQLAANNAICELLRELEVQCEGGIKLRLRNTILPTPRLKELSQRYLEPDHYFRFLKLETNLSDTIGSWNFLANLGVIMDDNLGFYLAILQALSEEKVRESSRVLQLYAAIQAKCLISDNFSETRELILDFCHREPFIYIPRHSGTPSKWVCIENCLLDAPADMKHKCPLDALYDQAFSKDASVSLPMVKSFLRDTLEIPSCGWKCHVNELRYLQSQGCMDTALIRSQYERLQQSITPKSAQIKQLRAIFNNLALVFHQPYNIGEPAWYYTTDCVWSTAAGLRGKANLRSRYPELKEFFVDLLEVDLLNINMIYDVLLSLNPKNMTDYNEAKTQLLAFSNLLPTAPQKLMQTMQPGKLLEKEFLPVKLCTEETNSMALCPGTAEFTIIDRQGPMAEFQEQVKTLDFDMEEVHDLEPFFKWAGLTDRYLSNMVREVPCLGNGAKFPVSNPLFDIRRKAHELLRVAKFFRSPRYQEGGGKHLYSQLRSARTWETDDISAQLVLEMNGQSYVVPLDKSDMYIAEEGGEREPPRLTIYIPHDETDQDVCIQHKLPHKLVEWMMTDPATGKTKPVDGRAVRVVTAVLNAKFASLPRILEREGVHDVDVPDGFEGIDGDQDVEGEENVEEEGIVGNLQSGADVEGDEEGEEAFEGDDVFDSEEADGVQYTDQDEEEETFEGDDVFDDGEVDAGQHVEGDEAAEARYLVEENETAEVFEGDDVFDEDRHFDDNDRAEENGLVDGGEDMESSDRSVEELISATSGLSIEDHTPRSFALTSAPSTPVGRGRIFTPSRTEPETPLSVPINLPTENRTPRGNHVTPQTGYFQVSPNWGSRSRGPNVTPRSSPQQYRELLSHMISAGALIRFPHHTISDTAPLRNSLPLVKDTANPLWMFTTWERGAAGELFIFELLKALEPSLPGFCAEVNWTSKLRNLVNVHPDYATLNPWEGVSEISDLQYLDASGAFTALLVEKGYLSPSGGGEETGNPVQPKRYYFEVKCTPQGYEEPFYMGGNQYNKMKAVCEEEDAIYIIFRVFNLYTDRIDVRLFVNPPELERQGLLKFVPEKYIVKVES
ncbi:hypothetical protein B0T21DRAFT_371413 [Apiosordaria backusii]|uniref:Protein NO VEIN C-terminal domain-containing protein n=1 Tax=Apiosordaria backusii TaxID=314023 RepID=A0AA40B2D2_9PEZI|nr:hypothetical protein B0T21DRAFT_371413 [Apiosordaria backusii]